MAQSPTKSPVRMTPTLFHIMLSLADAEKHPYAIMQEVADRTDGRLKLGPGSLYWAIHKLDEARIIEETAERPDPQFDDERRRYYRLTRMGRQVLKHEASMLAEIVDLARAKRILDELEPVK